MEMYDQYVSLYMFYTGNKYFQKSYSVLLYSKKCLKRLSTRILHIYSVLYRFCVFHAFLPLFTLFYDIMLPYYILKYSSKPLQSLRLQSLYEQVFARIKQPFYTGLHLLYTFYGFNLIRCKNVISVRFDKTRPNADSH